MTATAVRPGKATGKPAGKAPTLRVETVESLARLTALELAWTELYKRDPEAQFFLSWPFIERVARAARGEFRILVAWSGDGRAVGILPLRLMTRWSADKGVLRNELHMLGWRFWSDFTGILCDPDLEAEAIDALTGQMRRMDWGRLLINYMRTGPARLERFCRAFPEDLFEHEHQEQKINKGQVDNLKAPYVDLADSFEAYLSDRLSANRRQKLRRLLRQLENDEALRVTRCVPETASRDVSILTGLWRTMYATVKGSLTEELAESYGEIVEAGLSIGAVYLPVLWHGDNPIAAHACFVDPVRRELHFFVAGRNPMVTDPPAGLLLHAHTIRWAIANGIERYEFLQGDEAYKYAFGARDRDLAYISVTTKTGANHTGRFDPSCRSDVARRIRRFAGEGKAEQARAVAAQARETWPDMTAVRELESLLR